MELSHRAVIVFSALLQRQNEQNNVRDVVQLSQTEINAISEAIYLPSFSQQLGFCL